MQHFSEREIKIGKGIAILLIIAYGLFSANSDFVETNGIANWVWPIEITIAIGDFAQIGISVLFFLFGLQIARYYQNGHYEGTQMGEASFRLYRMLLHEIFPIYILIAATSFLGRNLTQVYGSGLKTWVYALLDVLGLSGILGTPVLNPSWSYLGTLVAYIIWMPLLMELYRRYQFLVCILAIASPYILGVDRAFWNYLGIFVLGIACACDSILERLKKYVYQGHETVTMYAKLILTLAGLSLSYSIMQDVGLNRVMNCFLAFGIVYFSYEFLSEVKWIGDALVFLGKHSLNIWLIHAMLYRYYFTKQLGVLHYAMVVYLAVLLLSLLVSVAIEWGKAQCSLDNRAVTQAPPTHPSK